MSEQKTYFKEETLVKMNKAIAYHLNGKVTYVILRNHLNEYDVSVEEEFLKVKNKYRSFIIYENFESRVFFDWEVEFTLNKKGEFISKEIFASNIKWKEAYIYLREDICLEIEEDIEKNIKKELESFKYKLLNFVFKYDLFNFEFYDDFKLNKNWYKYNKQSIFSFFKNEEFERSEGIYKLHSVVYGKEEPELNIELKFKEHDFVFKFTQKNIGNLKYIFKNSKKHKLKFVCDNLESELQ